MHESGDNYLDLFRYQRDADHWRFLESTVDTAPLTLSSIGLVLSAAEAFEDLAN